jgi:hypothetical protein
MDTEKITTPFKPPAHASTRTRTFSGATSQVPFDRREGRGPLADADDVPSNARRTESHWEWIIDRATD